MAKRNPRKTLSNKLDALCREAVKLRDRGVCQKCGRSYDKMDTSHVISRRNKRLRWDLKNLKLLCSRCHRFWWHDSPLEAEEWFSGKYPDRYNYIMDMLQRGIRKWSLQELEDEVIYLEEYIDRFFICRDYY